MPVPSVNTSAQKNGRCPARNVRGRRRITGEEERGKYNVVDIARNEPHKVSEVICVKCGKRWIAVRPETTLLKNLECPQCGNEGFVIETGEEIDG